MPQERSRTDPVISVEGREVYVLRAGDDESADDESSSKEG
jgi:hypothetical protein